MNSSSMNNKKVPTLLTIKRSLGPLESEVMQVVWSKDEVSVSDVVRVIKNKRSVAYTTVMTTMDTLYKKGFLGRQKIGKAYLYQLTAPKDVLEKNSLRLVITDLVSNYGRVKVLLVTTWLSLLHLGRFKLSLGIIPKSNDHKKPMWYGAWFALLTTTFLYSSWDLVQNLKFFGTVDYIKLAISEPSLIFNRFNLVVAAVFESLPMLNITATIILFTLFILVGKKLSKLLDITIFPKLGRLA